jgi:hypothetical protein
MSAPPAPKSSSPRDGSGTATFLSFTARSLHVRITWFPLGADVDLYVRAPSGQEISYSSPAPGWGSLDHDCITTCTEENISILTFPETGEYFAAAHYFAERDLGPATVTAHVFEGGELILTETFVLEADGAEFVFASATVEDSAKPAGPAAPGPRPARAPRPPKPISRR